MADDAERLRVRVAILEAELAGLSGVVQAMAEHFEREFGLADDLVRHLHARAAEARKLARINPTGAQ